MQELQLVSIWTFESTLLLPCYLASRMVWYGNTRGSERHRRTWENWYYTQPEKKKAPKIIHSSIHPSTLPSIHACIHAWMHTYIHPSVHPSFRPSVRPSSCPSIRSFLGTPDSLSTHQSLNLFNPSTRSSSHPPFPSPPPSHYMHTRSSTNEFSCHMYKLQIKSSSYVAAEVLFKLNVSLSS